MYKYDYKNCRKVKKRVIIEDEGKYYSMILLRFNTVCPKCPKVKDCKAKTKVDAYKVFRRILERLDKKKNKRR